MKRLLISAALAVVCLLAPTPPALGAVVRQVATRTSLAFPRSEPYQAPVTFTATVSPSATGSVEFLEDGDVIGSADVAGSSASLTTSLLTVGSHTMSAIYEGDAAHRGSASGNKTITITAPKLAIGTASLPSAQAGTFYTTQLSATGGTPTYTWVVSIGKLPLGLGLSPNGTIAGTPGKAGTSAFTVKVTDSSSPAQAKSVRLSIVVAAVSPPPPPTLVITSSSNLADGTEGASYNATLSATGGTPAYSWAGIPPAGLTLSSSGVISGTPTVSGPFTFTTTVTDSGSPAQTASAQESITIGPSAPPPPPPPPGAAKLYLYPQAPVATRGSYQTVTAIVTGVNDKTVTWSADGGNIVGTNPCVVNEPCTVALHVATSGTYHLTATSNADSTQSSTSTITVTESPVPATTHPRLGGITVDMLPELRAKAVLTNPLYAALYNRAVTQYGNLNSTWAWSCKGGSGLPSTDQTENYNEIDAYLFAFMSVVDPNDSTYNWGCYGRDLWIYDATFWQNPLSTKYTSDTLEQRSTDSNYGLTGNHGNDSAEFLTLTPDWLMAGGYLSASDLTVTRAYFSVAAQDMLNITYTGARAFVGGYNSPAELNSGSIWDFVGLRAMGNNYTHSKLLYLAAASLTFNDNTTDDPPLPNTCSASRYVVCPDGTAGSLHAYFTYLSGGMLYRDWAHMEDPSVTQPAFNTAFSNMPSVPTCEDAASGTQVPCLGDGRGGESTEGSWYGYSIYRLRLALLSIKSAGYDDPILYGPQMSLDTSSWWDLRAMSDLQFLTYSYYTPQPRFSFFSTGDTLNLYRMPADFNTEAWMLAEDSESGRTDRIANLEWPLIYTSVGGVQSFFSNLNNDYASVNAVPLFVALPAGDPTTNAPVDPRASFPTDVFDAGNQHVMVRSGWDANGPESDSWGDGGTNSIFSYYCTNSRVDHEHETCGGFDVLSDGEYITKTRTVFNDYNMMLATAEHSNIAGYGNDPGQTVCTLANDCYEWQAVLGSDGNGGGQLWHGQQAGSVDLLHAELPGYVAAIVDTTPLYNGSAAQGWGSITGVTSTSRSLVYLRGSNQVVIYDRGAGNANSKRTWMNTTGPVTVASNVASWPTRSGKQQAYYTALLPSGAKLSDAGAYLTRENGAPNSDDWETYSHLLLDAGSPAATQFLAVLQWGASNFTYSNTTLVQSTAGQNFDGALVGSSLVMFMRNWPAAFTTVSYPAGGATTQYVADLAPNTVYTILGNGAPASATTDSAGVLVFNASGSGNITVALHQ